MGGQTGHHGEDRRVGFLQPQLPLQGPLIGLLVGKAVGGVILLQGLVGGGIIARHVDAVGDAPQVLAPGRQDPGQAVGKVGILELLGVGFGNRRHQVGPDNGRLHKVDAALIGADAPPEIVQTQDLVEELGAGLALIFHVVDREDGLCRGEAGAELGVQVNRDQTGLPVVAVDDLRVQLQPVHAGQHRLGKIGKALAVVIEAVDAVPAEVILVVYKVDLRLIGPGLEPEQTHVLLPPGQVHGEGGEQFHLQQGVVLDALIIGQEQRHLVAGNPGQLVRQGLQHISQAARLDEGGGLGGDHRNSHTTSPRFRITGCSGVPISLTPALIFTSLSRMQYSR